MAQCVKRKIDLPIFGGKYDFTTCLSSRSISDRFGGSSIIITPSYTTLSWCLLYTHL